MKLRLKKTADNNKHNNNKFKKLYLYFSISYNIHFLCIRLFFYYIFFSFFILFIYSRF